MINNLFLHVMSAKLISKVLKLSLSIMKLVVLLIKFTEKNEK